MANKNSPDRRSTESPLRRRWCTRIFYQRAVAREDRAQRRANALNVAFHAATLQAERVLVLRRAQLAQRLSGRSGCAQLLRPNLLVQTLKRRHAAGTRARLDKRGAVALRVAKVGHVALRALWGGWLTLHRQLVVLARLQRAPM